jgi:LAO/AO transport system kinase
MAIVRLSQEDYFLGISTGQRAILSKAITLVESTLPSDKILAKELLKLILPLTGKSFRLGISGVPGVGKSTFIEIFGKLLLQEGKKLAVLTIDPSSKRTAGSILGDKTRMSQLSAMEEVFIRPSPSSNLLGGVGRCTAESILLCEAAGYDFIIIETVGVGQSEIQVKNLVDYFMVMLLPGGGDDLQGIKKGIIEEADLIVINKAEEATIALALESKCYYEGALNLLHEHKKVLLSSTKTQMGMAEIVAEILAKEKELTSNGLILKNRQEQKVARLKTELPNRLEEMFFAIPGIKQHWHLIEIKILANEITVEQGLDELIACFRP